MNTAILDLESLLHRPAEAITPGQRLADLLGGETAAFTTLSIGDLIYDRVSIDPNALEAFQFLERPAESDIYQLAVWSHKIEQYAPSALNGQMNRLKGSVFERIAATSLRQSGAHVTFPASQNNPGWDFLVNGTKVQAKCGIRADLVMEHLHRYPDIPNVVVSENLADHFSNNANIIPIPGASEALVRRTTEHSLHSAADMLDLHLTEIVPVVAALRNACAWIRGQTDLAAIVQNIAVEGPGRYLGAHAGHVAGAAFAAFLGGWPAVLMPVATSAAGFRVSRVATDAIKRNLLLRAEHAELITAIRCWCKEAVSVLDRAIAGGWRDMERYQKARQSVPPLYATMIDDWLERLVREQDQRTFHRQRFERAACDPRFFGARLNPLELAAAALGAANRAGILIFEMPKRQLTEAAQKYRNGMLRHLLKIRS